MLGGGGDRRASISVNVSGTSKAGHSTANSNGSAGGSGHNHRLQAKDMKSVTAPSASPAPLLEDRTVGTRRGPLAAAVARPAVDGRGLAAVGEADAEAEDLVFQGCPGIEPAVAPVEHQVAPLHHVSLFTPSTGRAAIRM